MIKINQKTKKKSLKMIKFKGTRKVCAHVIFLIKFYLNENKIQAINKFFSLSSLSIFFFLVKTGIYVGFRLRIFFFFAVCRTMIDDWFYKN